MLPHIPCRSRDVKQYIYNMDLPEHLKPDPPLCPYFSRQPARTLPVQEKEKKNLPNQTPKIILVSLNYPKPRKSSPYVGRK